MCDLTRKEGEWLPKAKFAASRPSSPALRFSGIPNAAVSNYYVWLCLGYQFAFLTLVDYSSLYFSQLTSTKVNFSYCDRTTFCKASSIIIRRFPNCAYTPIVK